MNSIELLHKKDPNRLIGIIASGTSDVVKSGMLNDMFVEHYGDQMLVDASTGATYISGMASVEGNAPPFLVGEAGSYPTPTPVVVDQSGTPDAKKSAFPWGGVLTAAGGILGGLGSMFGKKDENNSPAPTPEPPKSDNTMLYIGIAVVVVLAVVYFMTRGGLKKTN